MVDEQESIYKALKPKHRKFVDAYLTNLNGAEAARQAGYSDSSGAARVTAQRLLSDNNISAAIQERLRGAAMSADEVLARLTEQGKASIADFFHINADDTVGDVNTAYLKAHGHLVKKIKVDADKVELELYDGQNALVQLGRRWGAFTDKQELSGPQGGPISIKAIDDYRTLLAPVAPRSISDSDASGQDESS